MREDGGMAMSDADNELLELQRASATQGHAAGLPHGNAAADPTTLTTFAARRQAQREAWGQFVAIEPIHVGNALAFSVGSAVPLEHVIKYDLEAQELVARVATPEQARAGKTFGSEDEFRKANPHVKSRQRQAPELHPVALDPRGGAAHLDTDGKHGPVNEPSYEEKPKASGSKGADGKDTDAKSAAGKASA